ncbi:MAG: LPXTG cell wall anchor domain-containing protein [Clostridia bacterium]|nr:LPXTG cell wall anchor domain-containing protein [Clostridia bacterium]
MDPLYTQYPVPATGDESNVMLYGMALVLSAAMLVILGKKKVHA